jgi:hypothetical protein
MPDRIELELLDVDALHPHPNNARLHPADQISLLKSALKEYGWTNPVIVDEDNVILAGHGRVLAIMEIWSEEGVVANVPEGLIPVVRRTGLSEAQKRAYALADNKIALRAGWDVNNLYTELEFLGAEGFDVNALGFTDTEVGRIHDDYAELTLGSIAGDASEYAEEGTEGGPEDEDGAPAPVDASPAPDGPRRTTDREAEPDQHERPRGGETFANSGDTDTSTTYSFSTPLTHAQRVELFEALAVAKEHFGVKNTPDALMGILREWRANCID